jgi:hypothetical protein
MNSQFVFLAALYASVSPFSVLAGVYCLPPTPYSSLQDSTFDLTDLGSTFFVENMEQGITIKSGALYAPASGLVVLNATIRPPGSLTDSVDADDGVIDGRGNDGNSVVPVTYTVFPTLPFTFQSIPEFLLFGVPHVNAFGFVWTDGFQDSEITLGVSQQGGCRYQNLMDTTFSGETAEDRFVGLIADEPFNRVTVLSLARGDGANVQQRFEFDHVQFGLQAVPEPALHRLTGILMIIIITVWRVRFR